MLTVLAFTPEMVPSVCDYIQSISEFDEITSQIPEDRDVCEVKLKELIETGEGVGLLVWDTEFDSVAGIGILCAHTLWWSDTKVLGNILYYIEPMYRRTRAPKLLLDTFKKFADTKNMKLLFDTVSGPSTDFNKFDKYFQYNGLKRIGTQFIYENQVR